MAIEDIKRLPASYDANAVVSVDLKKTAGTDARNQVAESVNRSSESQQGEHDAVAVAPGKDTSENELEINAAIDKLQDYVQRLDRELQFSVDKDTGRTVVKIFDAQTQEVVRQIPSEELLEITKSLERTQGVLFRTEA